MSSVIKCPEYNQQFLIYVSSTRAFTTTFVLKNNQFLESLFWLYLNLATYQSRRMKLSSCCQDNHCLFSRREKNQRLVECQLSLSLKATVSEHTWYSPQEQDTQEN